MSEFTSQHHSALIAAKPTCFAFPRDRFLRKGLAMEDAAMFGKIAICAVLFTLSAAGSFPARAEEKSAGVPMAVNAAPEAGARRGESRPRQAAPEWIAACPTEFVDVAGASSAERLLICEAAADAVRLLGRCQIFLRRPLHIEVSGAVRNPFGNAIFGRFDAAQDIAFLTRLENIAPMIGDTAYSGMPLPDFYRSLVVHEVVHGSMHQNYRRPPTSRAASEYPAYALQVASLAPGLREKFMQTADNRGGSDGGSHLLFNDIVLSFDPYFFAARAYAHFAAASGGCSGLRALLEGDVQFVVRLE
jgi:hypothetical protein